MKNIRYTMRVHVTPEGRAPFKEWMESLRDTKTRARIQDRLTRLEHGNFGDHKKLGEHLHELRFHFGPGYRVYFALVEKVVVCLLGGGDKASQRNDIARALEYIEQLSS